MLDPLSPRCIKLYGAGEWNVNTLHICLLVPCSGSFFYMCIKVSPLCLYLLVSEFVEHNHSPQLEHIKKIKQYYPFFVVGKLQFSGKDFAVLHFPEFHPSLFSNYQWLINKHFGWFPKCSVLTYKADNSITGSLKWFWKIVNRLILQCIWSL